MQGSPAADGQDFFLRNCLCSLVQKFSMPSCTVAAFCEILPISSAQLSPLNGLFVCRLQHSLGEQHLQAMPITGVIGDGDRREDGGDGDRDRREGDGDGETSTR